jgi:hypothetical protein
MYVSLKMGPRDSVPAVLSSRAKSSGTFNRGCKVQGRLAKKIKIKVGGQLKKKEKDGEES